MQQSIGVPADGDGRPSASNGIALASAAIGGVSALLSGSFGYSHAKSAYEAATGSSAGFGDYITVASDTPSLMAVWFATYGPLAGFCGAIAGAGVGYAVGTKWAETA